MPLIVAGIIAAVKWIAHVAVTYAIVVAKVMAMVGTRIWAGLKLIKTGVLIFASGVVRGAEWLFRTGLPRLFQIVYQFIQKVQTLIRNVMTPILQALKRVQEILDKIWTGYVRPILDILERARAVLRLLDVLGVDWAKKIEGILFEIERRIFQGFQIVQSNLNKVISLVNQIMDPFGLIRRRVLLGSLGRAINQVWALFVNSGIKRDPKKTLPGFRDRFKVPPFDDPPRQFGEGLLEATPQMRESVALFRELTGIS